MTPAEQDSRERIQAEKPSSPSGIQAEKPIPPWEIPGFFRLPSKPHRGNLLFGSAIVGLILTLCAPMYGLPLLIAFPLSLATGALARRDLASMQQGLMDPEGEKQTREARELSRAVFWICVVAGGVVLFWLLAAWMVKL